MLEQEVTQTAMESNPSNNPVGCRTGDAIITNAYNLPCSKVIHTVGPRYNEKYRTAAENMLHSCYRACIQILVENGLRTVAFSCIHSERKNYEAKDAVPIALRTLRRWLEHYPGKVDRICLCVQTRADYNVYVDQLKLYFPRSPGEAKLAAKLLPKDVGNEWGETVSQDRLIRVNTMPHGPQPKALSTLQQSTIGANPKRGKKRDPTVRYDGETEDTEAVVPEKNDEFSRVMPVTGGTVTADWTADTFTQMAADPDAQRKATRTVPDDQTIIYGRYLKRTLHENFSDIESMKVIYRCGTDVLKRPVICMVASRVPSPQFFDRLLLYFIKVMDGVSDKEHVLVYFHAGINHKPAFSWMRKVYRLLPQKYKKNMRALYAVHPTVWLGFVTSFFKPFVNDLSKVHMVETLETLFQYVPSDNVTIPEEVSKHELSSNPRAAAAAAQQARREKAAAKPATQQL
eukprot:NODE_1302_length_1388_cov_3.858049_g1291_i0.p1 GENE.NODE_1302_length_1388_cov_3.858049_g1291_i0~~NODE_1302_length_1388_cov_3.858049_g1291_i0.p1  ORF type:complete len:458 (-),score=80.16 NODE_1302_length_1388_cov_3.858049_g1291_i0:15-1388(-)